MSEIRPETGPGEISIFRAVVVAAARVKQLRRGSKPLIELAGKRQKNTTIAMEEVRRGLIGFTQSGVPHTQQTSSLLSSIPSADDPGGIRNSTPEVNKLVSVINQRLSDSSKLDDGYERTAHVYSNGQRV